jgi:hypothetical protein
VPSGPRLSQASTLSRASSAGKTSMAGARPAMTPDNQPADNRLFPEAVLWLAGTSPGTLLGRCSARSSRREHSCMRVWRTFAGMQRISRRPAWSAVRDNRNRRFECIRQGPRTTALPALYWTADCTKSDVSFSTRPRCVAGASVRAAAASRARKGARTCMSNAGFAVNAARNTSVMRGLVEAELTCGDMVPLPVLLEVPQAPWLNRELN